MIVITFTAIEWTLIKGVFKIVGLVVFGLLMSWFWGTVLSGKKWKGDLKN
jgi:hypothetical protein